MKNQMAVPKAKSFNRTELLENLLQISIALSASRDRREMLEMILTEARRLTNAQAGTLYIKHQDQLQFVVAQNDVIDLSTIDDKLIGKNIKIANNSLAGFAALTGRIVNIPDSHHLTSGAPFRINRDFDQTTGYDTRSILAIPLKCPDGEVVGVLELINCQTQDGAVVPFQLHQDQPIMSLASMAAVSIHNLLLTERLKRANLDTIIRLSVIAEFRDRGTAEHIKRISHISALIARAMKLDDEQVELIQSASPMHDIGKIGIADSILLKPGPLTDEERKIVEKHTIIGGEILANPTNELMITARDIAMYHHERWDGEGYPHHLKKEEIPLSARIVALSDVFDALATERCYKKAYPMDKVIPIIRQEVGKHFDPNVAKAFFSMLDHVVETYNAYSKSTDKQAALEDE